MAGFTRTRILKFVGYPAFFIVSFILFLLWTFPIDRFEPILEEQLEKALGREVEIGDLSISLTGNLVLSMIEISVPEEPEESSGADDDDDDDDEWDDDEKESADDKKDDSSREKKKPALKYLVEEMVIDVGFIGLAFGQLDVELDMDFLDGDLEISFVGSLPSGGDSSADALKRADKRRKAQAKKRRQARRPVGARGETGEEGEDEEQSEEGEDEEDEDDQALSFSLAATGLNLRKLHDLRNKSPLPVSGKMDLKIKIRSATGDFRDADGHIVFEGRNIAFGNGRSKIEVGGMPMSVDEIKIDALSFEVVFENGIGQVKKSNVDSRDFDASVEGTITLADPIERSRFNIYLMFKILDGYKDKSASSKALAENMDSFSVELRRAHRTDGYYGFLYRGTLQTAKLSPSKRGLARSRKSADRSKRKKNVRKKSRPETKAPRPSVGTPDRGAELKTPRGVHTGGEDPRGATADRRPLTIPGMDLDARKAGLEKFQAGHGGQKPSVDVPPPVEDEVVEEEEPSEEVHEEAVEEDTPSGEETGENDQAGNPEGANDVAEEE